MKITKFKGKRCNAKGGAPIKKPHPTSRTQHPMARGLSAILAEASSAFDDPYAGSERLRRLNHMLMTATDEELMKYRP